MSVSSHIFHYLHIEVEEEIPFLLKTGGCRQHNIRERRLKLTKAFQCRCRQLPWSLMRISFISILLSDDCESVLSRYRQSLQTVCRSDDTTVAVRLFHITVVTALSVSRRNGLVSDTIIGPKYVEDNNAFILLMRRTCRCGNLRRTVYGHLCWTRPCLTDDMIFQAPVQKNRIFQIMVAVGCHPVIILWTKRNGLFCRLHTAVSPLICALRCSCMLYVLQSEPYSLLWLLPSGISRNDNLYILVYRDRITGTALQ